MYSGRQVVRIALLCVLAGFILGYIISPRGVSELIWTMGGLVGIFSFIVVFTRKNSLLREDVNKLIKPLENLLLEAEKPEHPGETEEQQPTVYINGGYRKK